MDNNTADVLTTLIMMAFFGFWLWFLFKK